MFLAFALASCGGGGNSPESVADVETHHVLLVGIDTAGLAAWLTTNSDGVITVAAGQAAVAGGVRFTCPDGGAVCEITVSQTEQGITATSTGGEVTAEEVQPVQMQIPLVGIDTAGLAAWLTTNSDGVITVAAGQTAVAGGVRFTCPDGGAVCEITVSQTEQGITATSTGGEATAEEVQTQQSTATGGAPVIREIDPFKLHAGMSFRAPEWGFENLVIRYHDPTSNDFNLPDTRATVSPYTTLRVNPSGSDDASSHWFSENEKTSVPGIGGWRGDWYRHVFDSGATLETVLYSNRGGYEPGRYFWDEYNGSKGEPFIGGNGRSGQLMIGTGRTGQNSYKVSIQNVEHWEGVGVFSQTANPADPFILIGSYHGVSGVFHCLRHAGNLCAVNRTGGAVRLGHVNASGVFFQASNTLGEWFFEPYDRDERVPGSADKEWNVYGWWLYRPADGGDYIAQAGASGTNDLKIPGLQSLSGTATYSGGAAGLYAFVRGNEGGDTGNFTARARLTVDFDRNKATGRIDRFTGADGRSRDWSVELLEQDVADDGQIYDNSGSASKTKWTISGRGFDDGGGEWSGTIELDDSAENDKHAQPTVATGSFTARNGAVGRMVGGFGVNRQ